MLTAISGVTKSTTIKSTRGLYFKAKEDLADTAVELPAEALVSIKCKIVGENHQGAHGENTVGQKIEGELILYAGDSSIRTFAHELVTKSIKSVEFATTSGKIYTFAVGAGVTRPALTFAYSEATLASEKDDPTLITLKMTGYRDNLVMS